MVESEKVSKVQYELLESTLNIVRAQKKVLIKKNSAYEEEIRRLRESLRVITDDGELQSAEQINIGNRAVAVMSITESKEKFPDV